MNFWIHKGWAPTGKIICALAEWLLSHSVQPDELVKDPLTNRDASRVKILYNALSDGAYRFTPGGPLEIRSSPPVLWHTVIHRDDIHAFIEGVRVELTTDLKKAPQDVIAKAPPHLVKPTKSVKPIKLAEAKSIPKKKAVKKTPVITKKKQEPEEVYAESDDGFHCAICGHILLTERGISAHVNKVHKPSKALVQLLAKNKSKVQK